MRLLSSLLYLLSFILLLGSCAKEKDFPSAKSYPVVRTISATPDSTGTNVEGEITLAGQVPITEYGFVYTSKISNNNSKPKTLKKIVGTSPITGIFKTKLTADLAKNISYYVQAYAVSGGYTVYGKEILFKSEGSAAPFIKDFNPKAGLNGTLITITGENFSTDPNRIKVEIGNVQAQVMEASLDSIVVKSPVTKFTGSFPITVTVLDKQVVTTEKYTILGPHITHLSASKGMPGDELSIHGNYFSYTRWGPYVYIGGQRAEIKSLTPTEIKVLVPAGTPEIYDKESTVSITDYNVPVTLPYSFTIESGFKAVSAKPSSLGGDLNHMPSFTANGKAYFFAYDRMLSYEIASASWRNESTFPGNPRTGSILYKVGDKAYLIGGNYQYYTLFVSVWEYDYSNNSWLQKKNLPFGVSDASSFSYNGKIYFFGGRNTSNRSTLWQYDPETEKLTNLNSFRTDYNGSGFESNGKVYMVLNNTTWKYNVQSDSWEQLASLPDKDAWGRPFLAFSYNGTGYAITTQNEKALYRYNIEQNVWEKVAVYPGCINNNQYSGFAYQDKLFIGSFGNCSSTLYYYQAK